MDKGFEVVEQSCVSCGWRRNEITMGSCHKQWRLLWTFGFGREEKDFSWSLLLPKCIYILQEAVGIGTKLSKKTSLPKKVGGS